MVTVTLEQWGRREHFYPSWYGLWQMACWALSCSIWHMRHHIEMAELRDNVHLYVCHKCNRIVVLH